MKKSTKIALSLVASTMLFTGCGGGSDQEIPSEKVNTQKENNPKIDKKQSGTEKDDTQKDNNVQDKIAPIFTSTNRIKIKENSPLNHTVTVTDGSSVLFSLEGNDAKYFDIDNSGKITLKDKFYFDTPMDENKDNIYEIKVKATDSAKNISFQNIKIEVTKKDVDNTPVFTFDSLLSKTIKEGDVKVEQLTATSNDTPIIFTISGGEDSNLFSIDDENWLIFKNAPDFESANDENGDNIYEVMIDIKDSTNHEITKTIKISVTNIDDKKPIIENSTFTVDDNITTNTKIGTISTNSGDSSIIKYELLGDGKENFVIDKNGVIKTSDNLSINQSIYNLKITATNNTGTSNIADLIINIHDTTPDTQGVAQLGILKNATVKIFKINPDGSFDKLYTEQTSDGDIKTAGRFDTHSSDLDDDTFYIYQVTGGEDIDANDDGVEDEQSIPNKGSIRAIVKGSWLKEMEDDMFRVTALSEMLYINAIDDIKNNYADLESKLVSKAKELIDDDIDGDYLINTKDILSFNPITNMDSIKDSSKNLFDKMIGNIHNNKLDYVTTKPKIINTINLFENSTVNNVKISSDGKMAYIVDGLGLKIYDINNSLNPNLLSSIKGFNRARGVALSPDNKIVYVAGRKSGLHIINTDDTLSKIANIAEENYKGQISNSVFGEVFANYALNVELSFDGTIAYVVDAYHGIKIVDVSEPVNSKKLSVFDTYYAKDVAVSNDNTKIFIADSKEGFKIVDVSDPVNPVLMGKKDFGSEYINTVAISKDESKVYLGKGNTFIVMDITNPYEPTKIGEVETVGNINKIVISNNNTKAYVADGKGGIRIIDIANSNKPINIGAIGSKYAKGIALAPDESKIFIADSYNGLKIVDISNPAKEIE